MTEVRTPGVYAELRLGKSGMDHLDVCDARVATPGFEMDEEKPYEEVGRRLLL